MQKYQQVRKKSEIWNMKWWLVPLTAMDMNIFNSNFTGLPVTISTILTKIS